MEREKQFAERVAELVRDGEALIALTESESLKACKAIKGMDMSAAGRQIKAVSQEIRSTLKEMIAREYRNEFFPRPTGSKDRDQE